MALLLLSVGTFACGAAYTLASHKQAHDVRTRAMHVRTSVEALQSLLLQANAEFLLGLGSAQATDYGWPVERVGEAARCFERLEELLANDPASVRLVAALRQDTARWASQLADTAVHASASQQRATIDSDRLLSTNRNLTGIVSRL
ncbi:MAG TPA: diguanylate phosphodiesterase, partial [Trinickia sp.]